MCGIAGALGVRDAQRVVAAMSRALKHRGPDDHGTAALAGSDSLPRGALAHRRLSILDLTSAGHQPMVSTDGRYTLAFNGEIYNYRALGRELEREGVRLQSTGDTAVVLEGWARWGPAFVRRLEGMFAFALWDAKESSLYLARDVFGIKPLYYANVGTGVVIASELRGVLASGLVAPRIDRHSLPNYLAFGSVPEPATIIAGIRMLRAGAIVQFDGTGREVRESEVLRLSLLDGVSYAPTTDGDAAAAAVRRALEASIDRHLVSDVPVAVFLSGGLDSSAVAALAAQRAGKTIDGFTVTFAERRFDESAVARRVAQRYGIRHHEIPLGGSDLLAALPSAFAAMDQPTLDGINTHVVSEGVRAHGTKVVLSGLGGDELFAGYPSFRRAQTLRRLSRVPRSIRRSAARVAERFGRVRGPKIAVALRTESPAEAAYMASRSVFGGQLLEKLCGKRATRETIPLTNVGVLQQVSLLELTGYMRETLLRDSDAFSMAHALELRVPFVDREVLQAAFAGVDCFELSEAQPKPLLAAAVRDLIPEDVWNRPKQGFVLPFADWMRGPLASEVGNALGDDDRLDAVGLDPTTVRDVWSRYLRGDSGMTWSRPWALYSLVRWSVTNGVEGTAERAVVEIASQ
jgi:asparagine synthase (glutamine-hydrolysing)